MLVFLITAFVALAQQGATGYEYQPQHYQQQQTFTVNHNENPSQLTPSKSKVFFIKYETQQADENYAWAPTRVNPNELPREEQYSSVNNNLNNREQGYYSYQPQHHQQLNSQYNSQQQQTFTPNQQDIKDQSPVYTHKTVVAPVIHSIAQPPYRVRSNKNQVVHQVLAPNNTYSPSIQVNQNNFQGIGNNEALKLSSPLILEPTFTCHGFGTKMCKDLWRNNEYLPPFKSLNMKTAY